MAHRRAMKIKRNDMVSPSCEPDVSHKRLIIIENYRAC